MAVLKIDDIITNTTPELYTYKINNFSPNNKFPMLVYRYPGAISTSDSVTYGYDTSLLSTALIDQIRFMSTSTNSGEAYYTTFIYSDDENIVFLQDSSGRSTCTIGSTALGAFGGSTAPSQSVGYGGFWCAIIVGTNNTALMIAAGSYTAYDYNGLNPSAAPIVTPSTKGSPTTGTTLNAIRYNSVNTATQTAIQNMWGKAKIYDPDDPFNGADDSAPNGGGGNLDYDSDDDDFPGLPTNTVSDSGFVTLYAPTAAQLKSLADYLWSDTFSLDSFKKLFNNPMDCILGLSLVPVNLPHGTAKEITVGNLVSTVSCDTCTTQYVYVDCGSIEVSPESFTNSYLDFSPYTQIMLYLPYIGTQPLDTDEVMGSTIHVRYHIDVLTGAMCCFVKITNKNPISGSSATHVLYTYMGQCCESVPLSSDQWGNTIGAIMQAAAAIGGVVATAASGGAAAPAAAATLTTATTATVNAATSMKPTVNHSGSLGGGGGMMAQRTPKLIMKAPYISKPSKQQNYTGYPVNQTKKLSACSGFTQVQNINLVISAEGVGATQAELTEIENLLISGVYI